MIFPLVQDFADVLAAMPRGHPRLRILKLLDEAIRRDVHFIGRHPTTLFQCLWNSCWWYDCPEAAGHYAPPTDGWPSQGPPWARYGEKLSELLESWQQRKVSVQAGWTWVRSLRPPVMQLGGSQVAVFRGHTDPISSVAFSPDGSRIASGSQDGTVRLWHPETGEILAVMRGHAGHVNCLSFSADGRRIASGSNGSIQIWDTLSGAALLTIGDKSWVTGVAFSPDGRKIACVYFSQRMVRVWDAHTGAEVAAGRGTYRSQVYGISYSPNGNWLATVAHDGKVRVVNANTAEEIRVLRGHQNAVLAVSFCPDGRQLASASSDKTIRVWDTASWAEVAVLTNHASVQTVAYSSDGSRIAGAMDDGAVRVWETATWKEIAAHRAPMGYSSAAALSPDGERLVAAYEDCSIRIWNAGANIQMARLQGHEEFVPESVFAPDGRQLATGSLDRTVRIWDVARGIEMIVLRGHEDTPTCLAFSLNGQRLASGSRDKTIRIWDTTTGACQAVLRGHQFEVDSVVFSPDGRHLASSRANGPVRVFDVASGAELAVLTGIGNHLRYSTDGRRIIRGDPHAGWCNWDSSTFSSLPSSAEMDERQPSFPQLVQRRTDEEPTETLLEDSATGQVVARFADQIEFIHTDPCSRVLAGTFEGHVFLLVVEGWLAQTSATETPV